MKKFKFIPKFKVDVFYGDDIILSDIVTAYCNGNISLNELEIKYSFERKQNNSSNYNTSLNDNLKALDDIKTYCIYEDINHGVDEDPTPYNITKCIYWYLSDRYFNAYTYPIYSVRISVIDPGQMCKMTRIFKGTVLINDKYYNLKILVEADDYFYKITVFFDDYNYGTIKSYKLTENNIQPGYLLSVAYMYFINHDIDKEEPKYITDYNMKLVKELKEES